MTCLRFQQEATGDLLSTSVVHLSHLQVRFGYFLSFIFSFLFFFCLHCVACRVLFPWPGTEPTALNVLTTRPPGNSLLIFNIASLWGLNWVAFYRIHSHRDNEMQWQWWGLPALMGESGSLVVRRAIQSSWPLDSPPTLAPALGLQPPPLPLMLLCNLCLYVQLDPVPDEPTPPIRHTSKPSCPESLLWACFSGISLISTCMTFAG